MSYLNDFPRPKRSRFNNSLGIPYLDARARSVVTFSLGFTYSPTPNPVPRAPSPFHVLSSPPSLASPPESSPTRTFDDEWRGLSPTYPETSIAKPDPPIKLEIVQPVYFSSSSQQYSSYPPNCTASDPVSSKYNYAYLISSSSHHSRLFHSEQISQNIGAPNMICTHCGAIFWEQELKKGRYLLCCANGTIKPSTLQAPPRKFIKLYDDAEFRERSVELNDILSPVKFVDNIAYQKPFSTDSDAYLFAIETNVDKMEPLTVISSLTPYLFYNQILRKYEQIYDFLMHAKDRDGTKHLWAKYDTDKDINLVQSPEFAAISNNDYHVSLNKQPTRLTRDLFTTLILAFSLLFYEGIPFKTTSVSNIALIRASIHPRINNNNLIFKSGALFHEYLHKSYQLLEHETPHPSQPTKTNSQEWLDRKYNQALKLLKYKGYPNLYIKFTGNRNWPEMDPFDKQDLSMYLRIFKIKLKLLLEELIPSQFGEIQAKISRLKFDDGEPTCHLYLWIENFDLIPRSKIGELVRAQLPDELNTELYLIISQHNYHRCFEEVHGVCSHGFPKKFKKKSAKKHGGITLARPKRFKIKPEGQFLDNNHVISYNSQISTLMNASVSVQLVHKSILKELKLLFFLPIETGPWIATALYFNLPLVSLTPSIFTLSVFDEVEDEDYDINDDVSDNEQDPFGCHHYPSPRSPGTMLSKFFDYNESNRYLSENIEVTYPDFPLYFHYKDGTWHRRKETNTNCVGSLPAQYEEDEQYFLLLALRFTPAPKGLDDMKTEGSHRLYCQQLGLIEREDNMYSAEINNLKLFGREARQLFGQMLERTATSDALLQFERLYPNLSYGVEVMLHDTYTDIEPNDIERLVFAATLYLINISMYSNYDYSTEYEIFDLADSTFISIMRESNFGYINYRSDRKFYKQIDELFT